MKKKLFIALLLFITSFFLYDALKNISQAAGSCVGGSVKCGKLQTVCTPTGCTPGTLGCNCSGSSCTNNITCAVCSDYVNQQLCSNASEENVCKSEGSDICNCGTGACSWSDVGNPNPTPTPTPSCTPNSTCQSLGYTCGSYTNNCGNTIDCGATKAPTCSGCSQTTYTCQNHSWAGTNQGASSACSASACTSQVCSGCDLFNATCNASGQCQANSSLGAGVPSSQCNSACTGTWTCPSTGASCGQTCNSSGACQNNSSKCPGGVCGPITPAPTPVPTPIPSGTAAPTPTPPPSGACTCNGVPTQCVSGNYCSNGACLTGSLCPGNTSTCDACQGGGGGSCTPNYGEGMDLATDDVTYLYQQNQNPNTYVGEGPGQKNVIAVTRTGKSYIAVQGGNSCGGTASINSVSSTINGNGTKPTITSCSPIPSTTPRCTVSGNNAAAGTYTSTVTTHRAKGNTPITATQNYPLSIYVVSSALNLTNSCVGNGSSTKPIDSVGQGCSAGGNSPSGYACTNNKNGTNYALKCNNGVWSIWGTCPDANSCNPSNGTCDGQFTGFPSTATKVTLNWADFPQATYQGLKYPIDVYCVYMDGTQQTCVSATKATLADVPNGTHLFQVFGWMKHTTIGCIGQSCSADTIDPAVFAGTVAESTFQTGNGVCGAPTYTVSGNVFNDANLNKLKDGSETNYSGTITMTSSSGSATITYPSQGSFNISGLAAGNYTVTYSNVPSGFTLTNPATNRFTITVGPAGCAVGGSNSATCDTGGNITNLNFGINGNNHTISGNIFVDTNGDLLRDNGEANYVGGITVTNSAGGTPVYTNGTYTFSNLAPGTYTISYTSLPAGYQVSYPSGVGNPSFTVTIGSSGTCNRGGSNSAACDANGNITNLNFGISSNSDPWIQATSGNIRLDSGINNPIPANALAQCGGPNMSVTSGSGNNTPGIIYSGNSSATFGNGQSSSTGWVVSAPDGQDYTPPVPSTIRTSYNYILSNAKQQNITPTNMNTICNNLTSCALPTNLPSGIYKADSDLTLTGNTTFTSSPTKNIIIIVNGNLNLNGQIHVPAGSTAIFSASGDITVGTGVGEATSTSSTADLEGIYSADNDFIIAGANNCSVGPDLRLNIAGNVIANAALSGGQLLNQRNLCTGNTCPALSVTQRLDLIVNLPPLVRAPNYIWQEVAP